MRKVNILTIIGIIFAICVAIIFFYLGVQARTSGISIFHSRYIIKGKLFGESADIRDFVALKYNITEEAKNLKEDTELATVIKTYNFVEEGYKYTVDNLTLLNGIKVLLKGGADSWNPAWLSLAIKHQNGGLDGDCEDVTSLIVALSRANGINIWQNIGTITLNSGIYGHSWGTVIIDGTEYLLEGTREAPLTELKTIDQVYKDAKAMNQMLKYEASIKFNEKDVLTTVGADLNKELPPQLPPSKLQELKDALGD